MGAGIGKADEILVPNPPLHFPLEGGGANARRSISIQMVIAETRVDFI
jgi:hypothetical protein